MSKRKFYEIEQDDGKASPTSNRLTKRAKLMNSSDSKFKNMKKAKRYIVKLTDLNAKKNVIEEEDKNLNLIYLYLICLKKFQYREMENAYFVH